MTLSATDECVAIIQAAATPLPRARRPAFFERVSELLRNEEVLIPSRVLSGCQRAQNEFLVAPPIDAKAPPSPTALRTPFKRVAR